MLTLHQNVYIVTLGTVLGHACCTALAVIAGRYISTKISIKHGKLLYIGSPNSYIVPDNIRPSDAGRQCTLHRIWRNLSLRSLYINRHRRYRRHGLRPTIISLKELYTHTYMDLPSTT